MSVPDMASQRTLSADGPAIPQFLGAPTLHAMRLAGRDGLNSLFEYELILKTREGLNLGASDAINLSLDDRIGREIHLTIQLDGMGAYVAGIVGPAADRIGAGERQINAMVTAAELVREEGRHVVFRLTLRPWLYLATLTTDCKVFQNQNVVQILDELFADYNFPVQKRLYERYPERDYQVQYNETDFDFMCRLCQEWGISFHFEHADGKHTLVFSDAMGAYAPQESEAYRHVEFHPPGWKTDAEHLHSFSPTSRLTSGRFTTSDYDYRRPKANLRVSRSDPRLTGQADAEGYQWNERSSAGAQYAQPGAGTAPGNDPQAEGNQIALLRMQALRTAGNRALASGNLRGMATGYTFHLTGHSRTSINIEYLVLDTDFLIEEVGQNSQIPDAHPDRKQAWRVQVSLTAHPTTEVLRPALTESKPIARGPHTALVVGPAGQNIWTDDLGRIKVQFPWDRIGNKGPNSSCWVRFASSAAGNQQGAMFIPRIGQEVIVQFLGGDPDQPVCTGRVHNQNNQPPWLLPEQSALSGFRSRELTREGGNSAAGRSNHFLMDDTQGQIQAQLKSDHQSSSLSLGCITRVENNAARKDPRGEGFELRSDGHGVLRAADGLVITTESRGNAAKHAKDMSETVLRLQAAQDQHDALAEAAQVHQAQETGNDQDEVQKELKAQNNAIAGSEADPAKAKFPELSEPHLVLASPAGVAASTPSSIHLHTGKHAAFTSRGHVSFSVAKRWLVSAMEGIRLSTHKGGMKVIASEGPVEIQSHKDEVVLIAHKDVRITSVNDEIHIIGKKAVVIIGGGSYTEWSAAGIKSGTAGTWMEHAAMHAQVGPASRPVEVPELPDPPHLSSEDSHFIELIHHYDDLEPVKGARYELTFANGETRTGKLDDAGFARIEGVPPGTTKVTLGDDARGWTGEVKHANTFAGNAQAAGAWFKRLVP